MHYGYTDNKDAVLRRLKRAEGQVRGIARMVEADTYCIDIVTQIGAARAALDKVALELVRDHAAHCMTQVTSEAEQKQKVDELMGAIGRLRS